MMRRPLLLGLLSSLALALSCGGPLAPRARLATSEDLATLRTRSNLYAELLVRVEGTFDPESMSEQGFEAFDTTTIDLGPDVDERRATAYARAGVELTDRLAHETSPRVRDDLEILRQAAALRHDRALLRGSLEIPIYDVSAIVFQGVSVLTDERASDARKQRVLARLRRYAGLDPAAPAIATQAADRTKELLASTNREWPSKGRVKELLKKSPILRKGIRSLASTVAQTDSSVLDKLDETLAAYEGFVRESVLPKSRDTFRQRPELYALSLRESGIDEAPLDVAASARREFASTLAEMRALAPSVAAELHLSSNDYRDVLRELRKNSVSGDALVRLYQDRARAVQEILQRAKLVTLPPQAPEIRLATEAESAAIPAPFFSPPPLLDGHGERGVFVLPTRFSLDPAKRLDDFSFEAASWWLYAHEGRPGHELQYASMVARKLTVARAVFAFTNANVEGWGLYAEDLLRPYMPPAAQLACLQARLMRAAHAFLDIELNLGRIDTNEAHRVLHDEAAFSEAWTEQSIARYTYRLPAQAPSYFYGYRALLTLRNEVMRAEGSRFDPRSFHDFLLEQGLVSPKILREAVFRDYLRRFP